MSAGSPLYHRLFKASFMPRSPNSCNKVDASDVRASRRLVGTVARVRATADILTERLVSVALAVVWRVPQAKLAQRECQSFSRSGTQVAETFADECSRRLAPVKSWDGVESFWCVIGMPFVSDVQETHTVSMAARGQNLKRLAQM